MQNKGGRVKITGDETSLLDQQEQQMSTVLECVVGPGSRSRVGEGNGSAFCRESQGSADRRKV